MGIEQFMYEQTGLASLEDVSCGFGFSKNLVILN